MFAQRKKASHITSMGVVPLQGCILIMYNVSCYCTNSPFVFVLSSFLLGYGYITTSLFFSFFFFFLCNNKL